jgi:hypothetical protein
VLLLRHSALNLHIFTILFVGYKILVREKELLASRYVIRTLLNRETRRKNIKNNRELMKRAVKHWRKCYSRLLPTVTLVKRTEKKMLHEDWAPFATDKPVEVSHYALNKREATERTAQVESTCL